MIVLVRRNWPVFAVAVGAAVGANVSTQVLKYTILSRPEKGVDVGLANSLPSGHTAVAASAALARVPRSPSPRFRPLAAVIGSIFAIAAGASTLVEQWHRPSDVVAGMLVVAFWGCLAGLVLAALRLRSGRAAGAHAALAAGLDRRVCAIGSVVSLRSPTSRPSPAPSTCSSPTRAGSRRSWRPASCSPRSATGSTAASPERGGTSRSSRTVAADRHSQVSTALGTLPNLGLSLSAIVASENRRAPEGQATTATVRSAISGYSQIS